jgi:hypothetical protein
VRNWLSSSAATWPLSATAHAQHASKSYRGGLIAQVPPVSQLVGPDPVDRAAKAIVHTLRDRRHHASMRRWRPPVASPSARSISTEALTMSCRALIPIFKPK